MSFSSDEDNAVGVGSGSDNDSDKGPEKQYAGFSDSENEIETFVEPEPKVTKKKKTTKPKKQTKKSSKKKEKSDEIVEIPKRNSRTEINALLEHIEKLRAVKFTAEKKVVSTAKEIEEAQQTLMLMLNGIEIEKKYAHKDLQSGIKEAWGSDNLNEGTSHIKKEKELGNIKSPELIEFLKGFDIEEDDNIDIPKAIGYIKSYLEDNGLKDENNKFSLDGEIKKFIQV